MTYVINKMFLKENPIIYTASVIMPKMSNKFT